MGSVNAPTVFNAASNFKQFWDGRAETLEDQIDGPINAPNEMGSNWTEIVDKLRLSQAYVDAFASAYPAGIQIANIKNAIANYERSLTTGDSRFDQYLRGDESVVTRDEKEGYQLFKSYGCVSCHQGSNAGGNMFQQLGIMGNYFTARGHVTKSDFGRFNATGLETDKFVFKVPGLRNVARTAPYFHDGEVLRLEDAVMLMGRYQLGRELSYREIDAMVLFLNTLSGETTQ